MNIPIEDIEKWKSNLIKMTPSTVLREIAATYNLDQSTLGFILTDLYCDVPTAAVQAVWTWDIKKNGKGISDVELDRILGTLS